MCIRDRLKGASLLAAYSLGLGVPFLAAALAFGWVSSFFDAVKRHYGVLMVGGGVLLIITGYFVFTGVLFEASNFIQGIFDSFGFSDPGTV